MDPTQGKAWGSVWDEKCPARLAEAQCADGKKGGGWRGYAVCFEKPEAGRAAKPRNKSDQREMVEGKTEEWRGGGGSRER